MRVKRLMDVLLSSLAVIILLPFLILIAILVFFIVDKKVLFIQKRPGKNGIPFNLVKFRTMYDLYNENGKLLPDKERLTAFGRLLRSSSVDELPELFNVLRGEMSLVGPRPLLMEYLPLYSTEQRRRHDVCPGITGWAQVRGRNSLSWEEKFRLDLFYVDNQSLWLDINILWITMYKVFLREGISASGEATMPKFTGSEQ